MRVCYIKGNFFESTSPKQVLLSERDKISKKAVGSAHAKQSQRHASKPSIVL
jgi:hypothetical protein